MTAALITAAGSGISEFEGKLTSDIGGASPLRRLIMMFKQAGIRRVVVVTGRDAQQLERNCAHMGAVFLHNNDFETSDMLHSVKLGLGYLKGKCDRTFIAHAGVALFSSETVRLLMDSNHPAAVPLYREKYGHPMLLSETLFDGVIAYDGVGGLDAAVSACCPERGVVEVFDEGVLLDVRGGGDFGELVENHSLRRIRPGFKLWLEGEKGFFGPGALQLLTLAQESGSLKVACRQMGVSYSKAWKVIADVENQLGYSVIVRRQGGRDGGGIELTMKGHELIARYEAFERDCRDQVQLLFDRYFGR